MQRTHLLAALLAAATSHLAAQPAPDSAPPPTRAPATAAAEPTTTPTTGVQAKDANQPIAPAPGRSQPAATASTSAPVAAKPSAPAPTKAPTKTGTKKKADKAEKTAYKGPTETDIRVAYTDRINAINAGTTQYLDSAAATRLKIRLIKVDIVECDPVEERQDIYVCSILVESGVGEGATEFKRVEIAMVKNKDAWQIQ